MKRKITVLTGQIASGKTTLARYLERNQFERIVTYTTRNPRENETNGVDYFFIPEEDFLSKIDAGFFAEHTDYSAEFGHVYYGTSWESLKNTGENPKVIVLNPVGVAALKEAGIDIFVVCLDFDQLTLMRRALNRGDSAIEIGRRVSNDEKLFRRLESDNFVDLRITDPELTPRQIAEMICSAL